MSQEHTPQERRFERIEAALDTMAQGMATLTTESHTAFANINATQRHVLDLLKQTDYRFNALAQTAASLVDVQTLQGKNLQTLADVMANLSVAQAKTELHMDQLSVKSAETQGKLDALIDMWDRSIRERGGKNGAPPAAPPPAET